MEVQLLYYNSGPETETDVDEIKAAFNKDRVEFIYENGQSKEFTGVKGINVNGSSF